MKKHGLEAIIVAGLLAAALSWGGCGSDDSKGSSRQDGGSSSLTCTHTFECINGSCKCTTRGKQGKSCCDPESCGDSNSSNCSAACEVCS